MIDSWGTVRFIALTVHTLAVVAAVAGAVRVAHERHLCGVGGLQGGVLADLRPHELCEGVTVRRDPRAVA